MLYFIKMQNDTKKLAEAKQAVYLKGFTDGVMIVGPYAGRKASSSAKKYSVHILQVEVR